MTLATGDLAGVLRIERDAQHAHRFVAAVPDGWQQGRGAFGGVSVGLLVRACEASGEGRPLRSLTAELVGPVQVGPVEITTEVLRAGSGVTTVAARLVQAGEVQGHAVAVFGKHRTDDGAGWGGLVAPAGAPWRDVPVIPIAAPFGPTFAQHFEFRSTGPLPFSSTEAGGAGWVRPHVAPPAYDAALVAAMIDTWWPTVFGKMSAPRPIGTLAYMLQMACDPAALAVDEPLRFESRLLGAHGGYTLEQRALFDAKGSLVAVNQQTIAIIR